MFLGMLAWFVLMSVVLIHASNIDVIEIRVDTSRIARTTNKRFVSVAIDTGVLRRHWGKFDPRSLKVQTLASALTPCYLRVGGTAADFLIFDDGTASTEHASVDKQMQSNSSHKAYLETASKLNNKVQSAILQPSVVSRSKRDVGLDKDLTNFTMSAELYDELHKFVSDVGFDLIFDLNVLLRRGNSWDPDNAIKLLNYTASKGYKMAGWELGNEPNAFHHLIGFRLEAEQLAKDYIQMGKILANYREFQNTTILGPSTTRLVKKNVDEYFERFLSSGGKDVVTSSTFHQYYIDGRTATVDDFTNPDVLNVLYDEVQMGVNLTRQSGSKAAPWIGETSSAWGGGAEGLSDRYVAAFMWLDKLGISAAWGVDVIIRQTFFGGHYALLDSNTLEPNPDYWLTLMYKTLVGESVIRVLSPSGQGTLRVYAHCVNAERSGYQKGSVVFYIMNLGAPVNVTFPNFLASSPIHLYTFTPEGGDIKSQTVMLNGKPLYMPSDTKLPNLLTPVKSKAPIYMDSLTYSFLVFPDTILDVGK